MAPCVFSKFLAVSSKERKASEAQKLQTPEYLQA